MDISNFAKELVVRIEKDFDSVVIVDSGAVKGTGKTVFSIKLCKEICKLIDYKYSFDLIVFNPTSEKIVDLVKTLPRGCPLHIDEASKVAYKRDYQKEYQKDLIKFVNICRKFGKIIIYNNPDFWDLDKDLRNLADFRVIIVKRGLGQVKGKSPNPDLKDKWLRDKSIEIIEGYIKRDITKLERTRSGIRKTPNFLYDIPFGNMDSQEYEDYVKLSKKEEIRSFQETVEAKRLWIRYAFYMLLSPDILQKLLDERLTSVKVSKILNNLIYHSINAQEITKLKINARTIRDYRKSVENELVVEED